MKQYLLKEKLISNNFSDRDNREIEYIVVHDTGNWDEGSSLDRHYSFFENVSDDASYHYLVGNEGNEYKIYNFVGEEYRAWHCGDGKGRYGITNDNSIGIGMCVNEDSDYENNILGLSRLAAELLIKHDLTIDKMVRHYDASRKTCPESMSENDWELWEGFYDLTNSILNWLQSGQSTVEIENGISQSCEEFLNKYFPNPEYDQIMVEGSEGDQFIIVDDLDIEDSEEEIIVNVEGTEDGEIKVNSGEFTESLRSVDRKSE